MIDLEDAGSLYEDTLRLVEIRRGLKPIRPLKASRHGSSN